LAQYKISFLVVLKSHNELRFWSKGILILKMIIQIELELKIYNKFTVGKLKQFGRFNKLFFLEAFKPYEKNFNRFI